MGIVALAARLKSMNKHAGANPMGACMEYAKQTGLALTTGAAPATVNDRGDTSVYVDVNQQPLVRQFASDQNRGQQVSTWLENQAQAGVYAVDADDHAWNVIVMQTREVYVVDTSQQIYRRISTAIDFVAHLIVDDEEQMVRIDYSDWGDSMNFYLWGQLAHPYAQILTANDGPPPLRRTKSVGSF